MNRHIPRLLLAISAAIFAFGSFMHAFAFFLAKVPANLDESNLSPFLGAEMKVLWLADSATLGVLALLIAFIAVKPDSARGPVVMMLAFVPALTAALLYFFWDPFMRVIY